LTEKQFSYEKDQFDQFLDRWMLWLWIYWCL